MNDDTDTGIYDQKVVTKIDKMLHTLTDPQLAAIDALLTGADQETAASAAGVHRVTVNRWVNHHPEFQAELNRRRQQHFDQQMDRVRHIDNLVLASLMSRVQAGDDGASELWLKMRGLAALDTSKIGPTESDAIIKAQVERRIRECLIEDRQADEDEASNSPYERYRIEAAIEIEIAENLNECTREEAFNDRMRNNLRLLRESDGHGENDNTVQPD